MKSDAYRQLQVLEELAADSSITQRHLAKKLQAALGLTNLLIRRFVQKGYVKVVNVSKPRIRYLLTPKGIAEKTRLTYQFLEYSLDLYRGVRRILDDNLARIAREGGTRVVFFGTGEIAQIAALSLKEHGLELVGVVDDEAAGTLFLGLPVLRTQQACALGFDCGILGALNGDLEEARRRLQAAGIPDEKIVVVEQRGPKIRAVGAFAGEAA